MKNNIVYILVLTTFFALTTNYNACTNFLISKGASVDGSVMITYSADSYGFYGELYHYPATVYPKGTMRKIYEWDTGKYLGSIPEADTTYNVIGNMNEYQVAIGETTFGGRSELRNKQGIIDYGSLIYIALQRSKSAREAIKIMTGLVEQYGYYSSGESFSIADANEAWILELVGKGEGVKGAVWVARKIPDGYVCAHANQSRITTFPLDDPENCMYASDIISFAREKGYYDGADEDFDFAAAYNPLDFGGIRFCDARVWSFFRRVNGSMDKYVDYIKGQTLERMPLWIKPDKKLSAQDVMNLMRDHYEGTDLDMTKGVAAGPYNMPYRCSPLTWEVDGQKYFNERPISTYQTGFSFVTQSRSNMPREIGAVIWFGFDDTYMTVYSPMYASITDVPYNYKEGLASLSEFNWDSGFWMFNAVSNFVYPRYSLAIGDLQDKQNELEGGFISRQATTENTALARFKVSRGDAIEYLTEYSINAGLKTYNTWKELFKHLNMKYIDGVVKDEFGKVKRVGYPEETLKQIVAEMGDDIKVIDIEPDPEKKYSEIVEKADELVEVKDYSSAVKKYKEALILNPGSEYPLEQIDKLSKLISDLDRLHQSYFTN